MYTGSSGIVQSCLGTVHVLPAVLDIVILLYTIVHVHSCSTIATCTCRYAYLVGVVLSSVSISSCVSRGEEAMMADGL